ncbi:MAG: hypothetical protein H7287_11870 [Thermoleophilia bacterium]|nr:hypothetical protein [Thermoleophilia bacterium]
MTTRSRIENAPTSADPWWGGDEAVELADTFDNPIAPTRSRPAARPRGRRGPSLLARLLALPLTLLGDAMRRSPAFRTVVRRGAIAAVLGCLMAVAVGVILVNNIVISRSAELGKLDSERRDLQRDNAVLNAQTAQLSAPQLIMVKARRTLGMIESPDLPSYIYLQPCSHELTAAQRAIAARATGTGTSACAPRRAAKAHTSTKER